jgi:hypothetical protein
MVDHEVENTLREIRERVRAAAPAHPALAPPQPAAPAAHGGAPAPEALSRMEANLATTERAWSRLPPVLSYRGGAAARLELWLKRLVKRALHWFTWEQVNFNSAAHHALRDALSALSAHERLLAEARAELDSLRRRADAAEAELARLASLPDGLRGELRQHADRLSEEQRVCFRQLSLEAAEAAVTYDRARRLLEARVEKMEKSLESEV